MKQRIVNLVSLGWSLFYWDFQYRYRLTFLGYTWAIIRPLLVAVPIIFVGKQFNFGEGLQTGVSYVVYAFSGFILFRILWSAVESPPIVMWRLRKILKQVTVPYSAVIIASCYYVFINLVVYGILLVIAFVYFEATLQPIAWLTIAVIPFLIAAGLAIGILLAPISVIYRDSQYAIGIAGNVLLVITPILYTMPKEGYIAIANRWNPLTYLLEVPRAWLIGSGELFTIPFLISILACPIIFFLVYLFYRRAVSIAIDAAI